jgi:hypothetical protein
LEKSSIDLANQYSILRSTHQWFSFNLRNNYLILFEYYAVAFKNGPFLKKMAKRWTETKIRAIKAKSNRDRRDSRGPEAIIQDINL